MMERRPALGKGLSALLPEVPEPARAGAIDVDIDLLAPSDQQPRQRVDEGTLAALADSIRAHGVIQPILVRRTGATYRIIAGERRWRAAQKAGLLKVPVVIRDMPEGSERQRLELALVENLQREDLNPIEEALAYQRLIDEFHLTQDHVAAVVGRDRTSVANYLRLLRLPDEVRGHVASGALSMGHARAIAGLTDEAAQRHAARDVMTGALSVRETEVLVKKLAAPPTIRTSAPGATDIHTRAAEDRLRFALGTKVRIVRRRRGGAIEVEFGSEAELNRLYELLLGATSSRPSV
jgi:ParB family chromosome partitioning protein